jgi:hypothetical protein
MTHPLPPPPIQPFERLQVTDGLLMTADRWRQAHDYHRRRQNVLYQALHQPGIVSGLGVHLIPAPAYAPTKYRDGRWVQIQPGMAIDLAGNPIVVSQPIDFRITTKPVNSTPLMVYLVLSYVDPDTLNLQEQRETVEETFRVDEKNAPPDALEVEICRILLQPNVAELACPIDVLHPTENQLDFRHRIQAQVRSQATVQMAQVTQGEANDAQQLAQLDALNAALSSLYPALQGCPVGQTPLPGKPQTTAADYDLLYLSSEHTLSLTEPEIVALKEYLNQGGTLLADVPANGAAFAKSVMALAQQIGTPLEYLNRLDRRHPLRTQPFLFAALPRLADRPIQVLTGGGIVLVMGNLAAAWDLDEEFSLPRETIRTAQEFGINILKFACQRRSLTRLAGAQPAIPTASSPSPGSSSTPPSFTSLSPPPSATSPLPTPPPPAPPIPPLPVSPPPSNQRQAASGKAKEILDQLLYPERKH